MTGPGIPLRPVAPAVDILLPRDAGDIARAAAVLREHTQP